MTSASRLWSWADPFPAKPEKDNGITTDIIALALLTVGCGWLHH
jgi:hypothetical protein